MNRHAIPLFVLTGAITLLPVQAQDWPQLLGPKRDGIYRGGPLAASWPKEGPVKLWQAKAGNGFAGPVAADGKVILFHRMGGEEIIQALMGQAALPCGSMPTRPVTATTSGSIPAHAPCPPSQGERCSPLARKAR